MRSQNLLRYRVCFVVTSRRTGTCYPRYKGSLAMSPGNICIHEYPMSFGDRRSTWSTGDDESKAWPHPEVNCRGPVRVCISRSSYVFRAVNRLRGCGHQRGLAAEFDLECFCFSAVGPIQFLPGHSPRRFPPVPVHSVQANVRLSTIRTTFLYGIMNIYSLLLNCYD